MPNPKRKNQRHALSEAALADAKNADLSVAEVARKHGVPKYVIQYHRTGRQQDPSKPPKRKIPKEELKLLGTMSDADLGRRWNVGRAAVEAARRRSKPPIPAFQPTPAIPL